MCPTYLGIDYGCLKLQSRRDPTDTSRMTKFAGRAANIIFWDTGGDVYYSDIRTEFLPKSDIILLCVSNEANLNSFVHSVLPYVNEIENFSKKGTEFCLIGKYFVSYLETKVDEGNPSKLLQEWAKNRNIKYFQTSSKTGQGVRELFDYLLTKPLLTYSTNHPHRQLKSNEC